MQDASGSDEFVFAVRGEWLRQDGIAVIVVQDNEVLATAVRGYGKTSSLVSAYFSSELDFLWIRHLGSDIRFLQSKGRGRHNRRIRYGNGGRSGSGGAYVLPVLV